MHDERYEREAFLREFWERCVHASFQEMEMTITLLTIAGR
jgi:hypothetical protein